LNYGHREADLVVPEEDPVLILHEAQVPAHAAARADQPEANPTDAIGPESTSLITAKTKAWTQHTCNPNDGFGGCLNGDCEKGGWWDPLYDCNCHKDWSSETCDNYDDGNFDDNMESLEEDEQKYVLLGNELAELAYHGLPKPEMKCGDESTGKFFDKVEENSFKNVALTKTEAMLDLGFTDTTNYMVGGKLIDHDLAFVTMRGTDNENSVGNWQTNLEYYTDPVTFSGQSCRVHQGFLEVVQRNWDDIFDVVKAAIATTNNKRLLVSGHSLGGALANIVAAKVKDELGSDVEIYLTTIGAPRTGDANFAKIVDDSTEMDIRVVNIQRGQFYGKYWDLVTQFPKTSTLGLNAAYYMHAGKQVNLGYDETGTFRNGIDLHMQDMYVQRIKKDISRDNKVDVSANQICTRLECQMPGKECSFPIVYPPPPPPPPPPAPVTRRRRWWSERR
jgi:hypothetical protein